MAPNENNRGPKKNPFRFWKAMLAGTLGLMVLFYFISSRKPSSWEKYKAELQAKGESLDYKDFIPPPVPDDQNILKTPIMERWMYRQPRGSHKPVPVINIPEASIMSGDWLLGHPTDLVEWKVHFLQERATQHPAPKSIVDPTHPSPNDITYPLIVIDESPLPEAISNLAIQANLSVEIDPHVLNLQLMPVISFHWENVTPRDALLALLDNQGLVLDTNADGKTLRVIAKPSLDKPADFLPSDVATETYLRVVNVPALHSEEVMLLIVLTNAPLMDAILNLTRQALLNVQIDPAIPSEIWKKTVTFEWPNVTATEALRRVLLQHRLMIQFNPETKIGRVLYRGIPAQEILDSFKPFEPQFQELSEACQRPKVRFDFNYEGDPSLREVPSLINILRITHSLALVGSAELALNQSEPALEKTRAILGLSRVSASDQYGGGWFLASIVEASLKPIWDGLASHGWNERQLRILQEEFGNVDLMIPTAMSFRAERAHAIYVYDHHSRAQMSTNIGFSTIPPTLEDKARRFYVRYGPRQTLDEAMIAYCISMQTSLESIDEKKHILSPGKARSQIYQSSGSSFLGRIRPNWTYSTEDTLKRVAITQTGVNLAAVGCALERYWLTHQEYPEKLAILVPHFIPALPHDIVNGQSLKYRREDKDHFVLYSIGWDEKDDDGKPAGRNSEHGDWVWRYP